MKNSKSAIQTVSVSVHCELDSTCTAEQVAKRLLRAENGISHIQSSSAVLNLPPSSSHSLAGEAQLQNRRKKKVKKAEPSKEGKKHTVQISHQSWPDFFPLLSSLCPSWRRVQGCLTLLMWVFKNFSVLEVTSLLSRARDRWRKCTTEAQRKSGAVRLDCPSAQQSEVKVTVFSGLWLLSTKQTQLICSPRVKKSHTLSLLHTGTLLCMSLTVLDWVCLLHSNTIDSSSSLLPLRKALVRGGN